MPELFTHPLVLTWWALAVAITGLFGWWTLNGLFNHWMERSKESRHYALFMLFSGLTAGVTAATLLPMSPALKSQCFRALWVVTLLSMIYWVRSLLAFLKAKSPVLDRLVRACGLLAALWALDIILYATVGFSAMYALSPSGSNSLVSRAAGDVHSYRLPAYLICLTIIPVFFGTAAFTFLKLSCRASRPDKLLIIGVLLTVVLGLIQVLTAGFKLDFAMPLLHLANVLEAGRINWTQTRRLGQGLKESQEVQRVQREQIEAQVDALRANARMVQVGERVARITHDLRGPLAGTLGALELIEMELEQPLPNVRETHKIIEGARRSLGHALTLAERITRQARRGANEPPHALSLEMVLEDAVALSVHRLSGIPVERAVEPGIEVWGRGTELTQLFVNLIVNAAEAIQENSVPWIKLEAWMDKGVVHARVRDSGIRPPDEIVDKMFRVRFTTHDNDRGTGLGLEICARIAEAHGGRIYVDREEGHTTICVELQPRSAGSVMFQRPEELEPPTPAMSA